MKEKKSVGKLIKLKVIESRILNIAFDAARTFANCTTMKVSESFLNVQEERFGDNLLLEINNIKSTGIKWRKLKSGYVDKRMYICMFVCMSTLQF